MTTPTPNPGRTTPPIDIVKNASIPAHAVVLLDRLTRLRVVTAPQAHLLTPAFAKRSLRNAYHRLASLVRQGWLVMDAVAPSRGAATPHYYRPSHKALRTLRLESKVGLIQRPAQHVLEYLILRAEVYARARADGWHIGSSIFLAESDRATALARFEAFLKRRALERYKAAVARRAPAAQVLEFQSALQQLPAFLPKALTFEYLCRIDPQSKETTDVVLLVVDDVRRAVASQVEALPLIARTDCTVLIRDCDSVYDSDKQALAFVGSRLVELRRAVSARFGEVFLATDTALPTVWARATRPVNSATKLSPHKQESS